MCRRPSTSTRRRRTGGTPAGQPGPLALPPTVKRSGAKQRRQKPSLGLGLGPGAGGHVRIARRNGDVAAPSLSLSFPVLCCAPVPPHSCVDGPLCHRRDPHIPSQIRPHPSSLPAHHRRAFILVAVIHAKAIGNQPAA